MSGQLPRVAVGYGDRSVALLDVAAAAVGVCELVWLIDTTATNSARLARIAAKVGTVVDLAELDNHGAASMLRGLGVSGMVTFFDTGMLRLAQIAAGLGLRFHTPEVALGLTDKAQQRRRLAAAGVPGPRAWLLPAEVGSEEMAAGVSYPSVLKPRVGSGSRHTYRLDGPGDLVAYLGDIADPEPMVVEELLVAAENGPFAGYLSVESFVLDGQVTHVTTTGRFPPAHQYRETGFFVPADLEAEQTAELYAETDRVLAALGVENGACHTEFVLTPDGPRLLEVNGRLGGGVPEMVRLAGGPDLLPVTLRLALGEPPELEAPLALPALGYRFLVQPPAGLHELVSYQGLDQLAASPGVAGISVNQTPGAVIDTRYGSRSFAFAATGRASDRQGLLDAAARIQDRALVTYAPVH